MTHLKKFIDRHKKWSASLFLKKLRLNFKFDSILDQKYGHFLCNQDRNIITSLWKIYGIYGIETNKFLYLNNSKMKEQNKYIIICKWSQLVIRKKSSRSFIFVLDLLFFVLHDCMHCRNDRIIQHEWKKKTTSPLCQLNIDFRFLSSEYLFHTRTETENVHGDFNLPIKIERHFFPANKWSDHTYTQFTPTPKKRKKSFLFQIQFSTNISKLFNPTLRNAFDYVYLWIAISYCYWKQQVCICSNKFDRSKWY